MSQTQTNKPKQEFDGNGNHRLVADDGRYTAWANYSSITMLDGWIGHTAFYGKEENVVTLIDFCSLIAVK